MNVSRATNTEIWKSCPIQVEVFTLMTALPHSGVPASKRATQQDSSRYGVTSSTCSWEARRLQPGSAIKFHLSQLNMLEMFSYPDTCPLTLMIINQKQKGIVLTAGTRNIGHMDITQSKKKNNKKKHPWIRFYYFLFASPPVVQPTEPFYAHLHIKVLST